MPVGWKPVTSRLEELIAEEQAKIDAIKWQAEPLPQKPIVTQTEEPTWTQPQTYTPPHLPTDNEVQQFTQQMRVPQRPTALIEAPVATPVTPTKEVQWWEQPAVVGEKVMEAVGQGISKVPILPKILQHPIVTKTFEFIQEKLEKPFASIIWSAISPSLSWKSGESWVEHEKREYENWEAPTYVKGLTEFAMPLWWIPYFKWAQVGARSLSIGGKAASAIAKAGKVANIAKDGLPSGELLDAVLFKNNLYSKFAREAQKVPGLRKVVEWTAGVGAGVTSTATDPLSVTVRALRKMGFINNMSDGIKRLYVPKLQVLGKMKTILGMNESGLVTNIIDKSGKSQYLYDVVEGALNNPENYKFLSPTAKKYVDELRLAYDDIYGLMGKEGLKRPKGYVVHRKVDGKTNQATGVFEKSEYGSLFEKERRYATQKEGVEGISGSKVFKGGTQYINDINESLSSTISHYVREISRKRFTTEVGTLGKTAKQMFPEVFKEEAETLVRLSAMKGSATYAKVSLAKLSSYGGKRVPSAVISKIRRELPEVAEMVDKAFLLRPDEATRLITKVSADTRRIMRIKPNEFKDTLRIISYIADAFKSEKNIGKILMGEIDEALQYTNVQAGRAAKLTEMVYKEAYNIKRKEVNDAIKGIRQNIDGILDRTKAELVEPTKLRTDFYKHYEGKQIIGEGLAKFSYHPVFKETLFPKEVVATAEKVLRDNGNEWLKASATASGLSRMLTAAMDLSSPFIQGLAVAGRNPVAWGRMIGKNLEFFFKPDNYYKYLTDPKVMATASERILLGGGSSSTFEYLNALAPLQRVVGKIPVVGQPLKGIIGQTYGRAEVAFTGGGEAARNYMWQALKKPNMSPDTLLDLGRTLDRMTGVMSTEALAIGRTQQDLESAFGFFAPRYTRAGLSFVADAARSGLAGAEARKSLGMLMAGGFSMYYGATKALGQTPNLDPSSGRFLTIEITDPLTNKKSHLGIGGITIALMRLAYDVGATAIEDPINLVKPMTEGGINRWDNPFIRFMYARTAPLTSTLLSTVVEQADYFGEPFESAGDWGKFMLSKVLPMSAQGIIEEQNITAGLVQFAGLREFPQSAWEVMDDLRDKLAFKEHGQPYDNLNDLQKTRIDKNDTIRKLQVDVDAQTVTRGDAVSVGFLNRERERDFARQIYEETVWNLQRAYDDNVIDGVDFRKGLQDAGYGLGTTYKHIDAQPEYKDVLKTLQEPKEMKDKKLEDIAYSNFMSGLYETDKEGNSVFEDKYGLFQYDKYNQFLEQFRATYGEEIYQYILVRKEERDATMPPLYKEYQQAKEILKPYWAVADTVVRLFGQRYADSNAGQVLISKRRKQMRLSNRAIAEAYDRFYKQQ